MAFRRHFQFTFATIPDLGTSAHPSHSRRSAPASGVYFSPLPRLASAPPGTSSQFPLPAPVMVHGTILPVALSFSIRASRSSRDRAAASPCSVARRPPAMPVPLVFVQGLPSFTARSMAHTISRRSPWLPRCWSGPEMWHPQARHGRPGSASACRPSPPGCSPSPPPY